MAEQKLILKMPERLAFSYESESMEAKARWFQSLTLEERMDLLCEFTDLLLGLNPQIVEQKDDAQPVAGRVLVLRKA